MINLDNFRNLQRVNKTATDKEAVKFIHEGSMATSVNNGGTDYCAAFVYENKEDVDRGTLYIDKENESKFKVGDIFAWDDYHYIIVDKDKSVKHVLYAKYVCYECNAKIDDIWGYFKGPKSNYINTKLEATMIEVSEAKPVFITNSSIWEIGDKLTVKDRPWRVSEVDNYSTDGVYYYSLQATTVSPTETPALTKLSLQSINEEIEVKPLQVITITTENGYFQCNKNIQFSLKDNIVTFTVPFGLKDFEIAFKAHNIVEKQKYKVVV